MVSQDILIKKGVWNIRSTDIQLSKTVKDYDAVSVLYLTTVLKDRNAPVNVIGMYSGDVALFYTFPHEQYVAATNVFKFFANMMREPSDVYHMGIHIPMECKLNKIVELGVLFPMLTPKTEDAPIEPVESVVDDENNGWEVQCVSCRDCGHPMRDRCIFYHGG